jgi:hypothetical protein
MRADPVDPRDGGNRSVYYYVGNAHRKCSALLAPTPLPRKEKEEKKMQNLRGRLT